MLGVLLALPAGVACDSPIEPLRPDAAPRDAGVELPTEGGVCEPWLPGEFNSSLMLPGRACLQCHDRTRGPSAAMVVAGTVFGDVRQRDGCPGVPEQRVVIVDAEGREVSFTTNLAGNFYFRQPLVFPVRARVEDGDTIREMQEPVDSGDCNVCHTVLGTEMAPGRIVRPL